MSSSPSFSSKQLLQYLEYILVATAITVVFAACVGYAGVYFGPKSDPGYSASTDIIRV